MIAYSVWNRSPMVLPLCAVFTTASVMMYTTHSVTNANTTSSKAERIGKKALAELAENPIDCMYRSCQFVVPNRWFRMPTD